MSLLQPPPESAGTVEDTITVHNLGPSGASGVRLEDALSADAKLLGLEPGTAHCAPSLPLRCTLTNLPAGATDRLKLSLRPHRPGKLLDTVSTGADTRDTNFANNFAKALTTVHTAHASVRIRETATPPVVRRGQLVRIRLTIAASDSTPAVASALCVRLPAGVRVRSASGARIIGGRVCWAVMELAPGAPQHFQFTANVGTATPGARLVFPASISGSNFTTRNARGMVEVPPPFVGCSASANRAHSRARIAC